jgi:hypothetical protein
MSETSLQRLNDFLGLAYYAEVPVVIFDIQRLDASR